MADRCWWCGHETGEDGVVAAFDDGTNAPVCNAEHEAALRTAEGQLRGRLWAFFVGLGGSIVAIGAAVAMGWEWLYPAAIGIFGAGVVVAPAVTPQTIELLGMQRGLALGRAIGAVCVAIGAGWTAWVAAM